MAREISSSHDIEEAKSSNTGGAVQIPMSLALLQAAVEGDTGELIRLLGLQQQQGYHSQVPIEPLDPAPDDMEAAEQIAEHLRSVTRSGDTVLHILFTNEHNELAFMVFQKDRSLLKSRNEMLETPLHSAAKVGSKNVMVRLIDLTLIEIKDVLKLKNCRGETALHEAAKHGHEGVVRVLMQFDPQLVCEVDNEGLSPLDIAVVGGYTSLVETMLENDPRLAYFADSNGLFPVHVAARMGNAELVKLFIKEYPKSAKLMDHCRRNLFHIAANENKKKVFTEAFRSEEDNTIVSEMVAGLIIAKDCDGNTPLHIAAMKGHRLVMKAIWKKISTDAAKIRNNKGLTPFDLSVIQQRETNKDMEGKIIDYLEDEDWEFTTRWFSKIMKSDQNAMERRTQVIGLGSVLVTTVAFAVQFALPGGFNQEDGTPVLARRYVFKAFIAANTLAFLQAFISLFIIISSVIRYADEDDLLFAYWTFMSAAGCMVAAFGCGSYVMLAPVSMPIAVFVLVLTMFVGSPAMMIVFFLMRYIYTDLLDSNLHWLILMFTQYGMPLLVIFCVAFL